MRNAYTYLNLQTPDDKFNWQALTPAIYISNTIDLGDKYDVGGPESLKHFKVTVDALKSGSQLLKLDTFNLYYQSSNPPLPPSKTSIDFNNEAGNGAGSPYKGTPLRFQRVHFRGQKGIDQKPIEEYYAIFLVSDPVQISNAGGEESEGGGDGLGGGYRSATCSLYGEDVIPGSDQKEQEAGSVIGWTGDSFQNRLIISDSLESQFKNVKTALSCAPGCSDSESITSEDATACLDSIYLIGAVKDNNMPIKITANSICESCSGDGAVGCYGTGAPTTIVTNIVSNGDGTLTISKSTCNGSTWTSSTSTIDLNGIIDPDCAGVIGCLPCNPCSSQISSSSRSSTALSSSSSSNTFSSSSSSDLISSSSSSKSSSSHSSSSKSSSSSSSSSSANQFTNFSIENNINNFIKNYNSQ